MPPKNARVKRRRTRKLGRPRKRWRDDVEEELNTRTIENRQERVRDSHK
jgi:hypothetical protein